MNTTILIVEDDAIAALDLEMILSKYGISKIIIAKNANETIEILKQKKIHLILLDIFLENEAQGISLLEKISQLKIPFIICTGFRDKSFFESIQKYRPEAYLIKPIEELSLINEVNKIIFNSQNFNLDINTGSIFIRQDKKLIKLPYDDIILVKSEGNYCKFFSAEKNYLVRTKISTIIEELPLTKFMKVHRNAIVSLSKIKAVDLSKHQIIFKTDLVVSYAKKYSHELQERFKG